ncbi:PqqD family protein [Zongyangia hominis]|uniref:PqqD family protein n=1 Tax=Zongyangia hominis TaxID=2763677 RepID=A0A926ICA3_9FIRM|nr:PqqD family protein [Zongyangia hominis]MBC8571143.1 PqqD family protein [Zongyangia hominis]
MRLKKEKQNYLDYVPVKNPKFPSYRREEDNLVIVEVEHKGFYATLAQKLAKTPRVSKIELDKFGSFIWECIDGKRTVFEISQLLEQEFGKEVQPVMNRVVKYFQILRDNDFISYQEGAAK